MNITEKDLFFKTGKSVLDSIVHVLESCDRPAPDCEFLGFDRPPEAYCGLVGWIGNIRVWDGLTMDNGLREGRILCNVGYAFDVTIRLGRCYVDFDATGNNIPPEEVESLSSGLYEDAYIMYVQWIGLWKAGGVTELDNCDPVSVSVMTPYNEGACAGWEFSISIGVM